jgi:adenosylhomocysteine nucleosidase
MSSRNFNILNNSDILLTCALTEETQGELNNFNIIYTGVGKVNATYELITELIVLNELGQKPKLVINFGTAGSDEIPIHTLVDCTKFIQRDMDASGLGFPRGTTPFEDGDTKIIDFSYVENPIGKKYTCGTGDSFVQDVSKELPGMNVFDMEAYALAKTCWKSDIDFVSYKYITDNADESSPNDWKHNCGKGIEEFKKVLEYYDNL